LHSFGEDSTGALSNDSVYEIVVNSRPFVVTENLFNPLRRLSFSQLSYFLWIDAICVVQQDAAERAQQVSEMGWIFTSAKEVIVWLPRDEKDIHDKK
jgi:hypothetical protein